MTVDGVGVPSAVPKVSVFPVNAPSRLLPDASVATMFRSVGSSSSDPPFPAGARRLTSPVRETAVPDTSARPPLPPSAPPRTSIEPAIAVSTDDSTVTVPPLPLPIPRAVTKAPFAIETPRAVGSPVTAAPPMARFSVVPTAIAPPPAMPDASTTAPDLTLTTSVACNAIEPPLVPAVRPAALTLPVIWIEPPTPSMAIRPSFAPTVLAWILPPDVTRFVTSPSTARAVSRTRPPSAWMTPELVTSATLPFGAVVTAPVTFRLTILSPYRSSVVVFAPASTTCPSRAEMVPELATPGPTRAARPASLIVMLP